MSDAPYLQIAGETIPGGRRRRFEMLVSRSPGHANLAIPIEVVHGAVPGPILWMSAAIHGDEINGTEIIRQVLHEVSAEDLSGTLIAIPIVNVFGFLYQKRYLHDRRDLNRCFPGSPRGSLASQIAFLLMTEVIAKCTHGLDFHTASMHRFNHPQIRANLDDEATRQCAEAFGAPVVLHAALRDGSLRSAAVKAGIPTLVFEGGETHRFNQKAIETGVHGTLRLLNHLGMLQSDPPKPPAPPVMLRDSFWLRSPVGGIAHLEVENGQRVSKGEPLGFICDVFGKKVGYIRTRVDGLVICTVQNPLVNRGDAVVHVGLIE